MRAKTARRKLEANGQLHAPRKLDIACGQHKTPGYVGIDIAGDADITHDLFEYPWPIKTGSVAEVACNHFVEHIPHHRPGWERDGWWMFFDELHRICRKGAAVRIVHPYAMSGRAFWDPTHTRYIHDVTWSYLDAEWRKYQGLDHYPTQADFEVVVVNGLNVPDEVMSRNEAQQAYMRNHYWNVISDLQVELRARK